MNNKKKIIFYIVSILIIVGTVLVGLTLKPKDDEPIYLSENMIIEKEETTESEDVKVIGYLTIESIGLIEAPIAEGTDMEVLNLYIGHFEETPVINGNIVLCGHNRGYENNYFANLKNVTKGDIIKYITKNKTFNYSVTSISKIKETDVEVLENTDKSQITLITCVENEPKYRYCVIAEKEDI